jgi:prepilin-type processing-associated H-X9-DG protein
MDYAGATPSMDSNDPLPLTDTQAARTSFWQNAGQGWLVPANKDWLGMIVRTPIWWDEQQMVRTDSGSTRPIGFAKVTDGLSKTMMISEKTVNPKYYEGNTPSDDRGWSDGWDPDDVRCTCVAPMSDADAFTATQNRVFDWGTQGDVFQFGSAHTGGFNAAFGDGSVHTISYDIDIHLFDNLGNRRDGTAIDTSGL